MKPIVWTCILAFCAAFWAAVALAIHVWGIYSLLFLPAGAIVALVVFTPWPGDDR